MVNELQTVLRGRLLTTSKFRREKLEPNCRNVDRRRFVCFVAKSARDYQRLSASEDGLKTIVYAQGRQRVDQEL